MYGKGYTDRCLTEDDVRELIAQAFATHPVDGKRVLILIPDTTRTAPVGLIFRLFHQALSGRVAALDYLIALGTHLGLDDEGLTRLLGVTAAERAGRYADVRILNHAWDDPAALTRLGEISADEIAGLTGGLMRQAVPVTINRMVLDYDLLIVCGPTFPHEVVGFSGGNKYFFPGISGADVINFTHWLGAVITNYKIIGTKDTPVRAVINRAAAMIERPKLCFAMVVAPPPAPWTGRGGLGQLPGAGTQKSAPAAAGPDYPVPALSGLYVGAAEEAWSAAADLSSQLHIVWVEKPFQRVLSVMPRLYDDIWTAGKGMYKMEPVIAEGGEVVIYAPHITEVSYTHGHLLDRIGYHCRDYFLKQWDKFRDIPGGVLAHSTHVRGRCDYDPVTGVERLRIRVTLATGVPRERCERLNLGYLDPATVIPAEWASREVLLVPKAGEMLYRVKGEVP